MQRANFTAQHGRKHKQLHAPFLLSAMGISDCLLMSSLLSDINNSKSVTRSTGKAACCNTRAPALMPQGHPPQGWDLGAPHLFETETQSMTSPRTSKCHLMSTGSPCLRTEYIHNIHSPPCVSLLWKARYLHLALQRKAI